jgi:hypothetical protein
MIKRFIVISLCVVLPLWGDSNKAFDWDKLELQLKKSIWAPSGPKITGMGESTC